MKVFQVLNHFLPDQTAGTEVYVWALSKQLEKNDVEIKIVIPNYGKAISEDYIYDELKVFKFAETSTVDRQLIMGFRDSDGLRYFRECLTKHKPDIVHFHELAGSNGITLKHVMAAKNSGSKVIFSFHLAGYSCKTGTLIYNEENLCDGKIDINKCGGCYLQYKGYGRVKTVLNPISRLLYAANINTTKLNNKIGTGLGTSFLIANQEKDFHLLIDHCDKVIVLTKWYEKILLLNGVSAKKIQFIPQGLPQGFMTASKQTPRNTASPLRIIFLGRISYLKGLHLLIEALLQLPQKVINLDIYGQADNSDYELILRQKALHLNNITWRGKLEPKEVINTMQQYDLLCLCSTFSEMSPLVIQEAFAAGIPVLASNVYGNSEQVKDGFNGWLFRFKDVGELKNKLQMLIADPSLIDSAKKNIPQVKNFETVSNEYAVLYKEILGLS